MVKQNNANKGTAVNRVRKHSSGKDLMLKNVMNSAGSSYGSKKLIPSDVFVRSQATADSSSRELRIIGLKDYLKSVQATTGTSI